MVVQVVLQRRWGAQWLAIKSWQWPTKINANYSTVIQHLKGEKAWYMWVYHELTTYQKNCFKVSSSLILCNNNEPFFDWTVTWNKILYNFIWQPAMTSSAAGLRRSSKAFPKAKLHQKPVMVTVWWSAAHLTHYSSLNPSKTITSEKYAQQIDELHWKLQCPQPALVNRKGPIL